VLGKIKPTRSLTESTFSAFNFLPGEVIDRTLFQTRREQDICEAGDAGRPHDLRDHGLHHRGESPDSGAGRNAARGRGLCHLRFRRGGDAGYGTLRELPHRTGAGNVLNAYFTYSVCLSMHVPWRTALAVVFFSGVLFLVLTVTRVREQIVNGMPECLKHSTAAGIGMFIAFVGLRNAKVVVANSATFVGLGSFADKEVQTACFGLGLMLILMSRKLHGAILVGIFGTALLGILRGITNWPAGIFSMPHPSSTFLQLDFRGATHLGLLEILFAFLFVDLFDNVGTLVGVCEQGGFVKDGKIPRVGRVLVADAVGTVVGSLTGTSTVTSYIESAAGVAAGARTGLSNVAVAALFLLATFCSPLATAIPAYATAPALILVGS